MTASTRNRFERWSGGMPLAVPVAFGAVLMIAAFASKLGDSSLYFYVPLVFAATGTMIWLKGRRTPELAMPLWDQRCSVVAASSSRSADSPAV